MGKKIRIAVDFDGVIHRYSKGWHDGTIYDVPEDDCQEKMQELVDANCYIIIFSTRAYDRIIKGEEQPHQREEMHEYLQTHGIPYDEISEEPKPIAKVYLDDRAVRFKNWKDAVAEITRVLAEE